MKSINPFLWFDNNAEEAAEFYTSIFENSRLGRVTCYGDAGPGPKGTVMSATIQLCGEEFLALNGGPHFKFTPAISFFVGCKTRDQIDSVWSKLSKGGKALMPIDSYPFSERFGWVEDRFGLSWQLNLTGREQTITPFLMYVGAQNGKAEEAMRHYTAIFPNASVVRIERFGKGEMGSEGAVKHGIFALNGQQFMAMDGGAGHSFTFTPAISLFVNCESQKEVDELWRRLSDAGRIQQCGWLQDKYGVSWQIIPAVLGRMLGDKDPAKSERVMKAMLTMQKIDIEKLTQAYNQQ